MNIMIMVTSKPRPAAAMMPRLRKTRANSGVSASPSDPPLPA